MRIIKRRGPARPRRVIRKLTPEQEAEQEALHARTRAYWSSPEGQAKLCFIDEEGCFPEMKEFRDNLMAQGYPKRAANGASFTEYQRRHGITIKRDGDPYTDE